MTSDFETHPYNTKYEIPKATRLLIVGTAPPPHFSSPRAAGWQLEHEDDDDFYYGSRHNDMWYFLENIAEEKERNKLFYERMSHDDVVKGMQDFLKRHNIWMHDVLQRYRRKKAPGKKPSASDSEILEPNIDDLTDFRPIFLGLPSLSAIAFTSQRAAELTFKAFEAQGLVSGGEGKSALLEWKKSPNDVALDSYIAHKFKAPLMRLEINERTVQFYVLPSPSGASARSERAGLWEKKQNIYKDVLFSY